MVRSLWPRLTLFIVALVASACAGVPEPPVRGATENASAPIERPSAAAVDPSIVRVLGFGCGAPTLGTGFAVDTDLIVTNAHIVAGRDAESLAVQRPDGTEFAAVLVGFDPDLDLALLRIDGAEFRPLNLVTDVPVVDGVAIGVRTRNDENIINEVEFTVDRPITVNWDGVFRDTESTYRGLRFFAEIRKGDSGSPLLINDRDAIGLVQSKSRGEAQGYAVGGSDINAFVNSVDPSVQVVAARCA